MTRDPKTSGGSRKSTSARPLPGSTLDAIGPGQTVRVEQITAGRGATQQLAQLGIRAGATLVVRRSAPLGGPVLVESRGSTVAIGRGMARKVFVRTLE